MRELVQDRHRTPLVGHLGHPGPEDIVLVQGHAAGVLHRAGVVLRHEQLVVLRERVGHVEGLLEEREALPGLLEDGVGVQVRGQRGAAEDAERDDPVADAVLTVDPVVGARDQSRDVRREPLGRREHPGGVAQSDGLGLGRRLVGDDLPVGGGRDGEGEGRLQVGLLEDGEDPA